MLKTNNMEQPSISYQFLHHNVIVNWRLEFDLGVICSSTGRKGSNDLDSEYMKNN